MMQNKENAKARGRQVLAKEFRTRVYSSRFLGAFAPSRSLLLILVLLIAPVAPAQIQPGDHLAICGDSITEQKHYSVMMETYLLACQPQLDVQVMQFGWGGEVAAGFLARMKNDVLRYKPTVATTFYGMNDGGYAPLTAERAQKFRDAQNNIVAGMKEAGVRFIVVGSPGAVDTYTFRKNPEAAAMYNKTLGELRDIAREVATANGVAFADVHAVMLDAMEKAKAKLGKEYPVAGGDGVHPAANGHVLIAYAFLKALGCDGNIGTITIDLASKRAEATEGHKVIESSGDVVEIQSSRYPFCFSGDPKTPEATAGMIEFVPFNQDLNRLMLVVRGGNAPRMRVSWGEASKEFSADELSKGINLAAEFTDNPFSQPFQQVWNAVKEKQTYETAMIKKLINSMPTYRQMLPDEEEALARLEAGAEKRDQEMKRMARENVKPVRHTIRVEPVQ